MQKDLKSKIEEQLKFYPTSRNCDFELLVRICKKYHYSDYMKLKAEVSDDQEMIRILKSLPTQENVKRIRAKFQSPLRPGGPLYLPTDEKVAKARGWKREEWEKFLGYGSTEDRVDETINKINRVFNRKDRQDSLFKK